MKKMNVLLLFLVSVLAACGGGKGSAPAPVAAATPAPPIGVVPPPPLDDGDGDPGLLPPVDDVPVVDGGDDIVGGTVAEGDFAIAGYAAAPADGDDAPMAADAPGGTDVYGILRSVAASARLYVSPKGADSNPGTQALPFRSIARAAKAARAGTKVLVAPGSYSGGFRSTASGTREARISYISTEKWGARIVPPKNSPNKTAWDNRGSYVDIVGFHVDGTQHQEGTRWSNGIYNGGSHDSIRNNHVHHIAHASSCTRAGGAGIGVDSYYGGVQADVISNLVHDIGPAGCRFVQGIYVSTSGRVKNNVIYRIAEGGIHLWHDARDVIITNNTVTASNTGIIVGGGNNYRTSGPNDNTAVYSNIVYDNKMGISEQGKTGPNNSYRNNLVYQNSTYNWQLRNGLKHTGTVSSAPLFVADSRASKPNLKLSRSSPAIGRATSDHAETTDFEGRPRNAKAGYDIGAYQH